MTDIPGTPYFLTTVRCCRCGEYGSLGVANDKPEAVQMEISAARRAAEYVDAGVRPRYDRFDYCPGTKSDELCSVCQWHYLMRCIATHEEP